MRIGKKLKLAIVGVTAAVMLFQMPNYTMSAAGAETVDRNIYDGKIHNGRVFAPLRSIGEKLGAKVTWSNQTKTATVTKDDVILEVKVGSKDMLVGDRIISMDVTPQIDNGKTYLPLKYIGEAFGYRVIWYKSVRIAYLEEGSPFIGVYAQPIKDTEAYALLNEAISKGEKFWEQPQRRAYLKPYFTDKMISLLILKGELKPTDDLQNKKNYNYYEYLSDTKMRIYREVFNGAGYNTEKSILVKQGDRWLVDSVEYDFYEMRP